MWLLTFTIFKSRDKVLMNSQGRIRSLHDNSLKLGNTRVSSVNIQHVEQWCDLGHRLPTVEPSHVFAQWANELQWHVIVWQMFSHVSLKPRVGESTFSEEQQKNTDGELSLMVDTVHLTLHTHICNGKDRGLPSFQVDGQDYCHSVSFCSVQWPGC